MKMDILKMEIIPFFQFQISFEGKSRSLYETFSCREVTDLKLAIISQVT